MKNLKKEIAKRIMPLFMAVAMVVGMAFPAMASEGAYTQTEYYYYFKDGVLTAAPHGHDTIESYDIEGNDDGTYTVTLYTQESNVYGITGYITDFAAGDADLSGLKAGDTIEFTSELNEYGLFDMSIVLSYAGHPMDLTSGYYLSIDQAK